MALFDPEDGIVETYTCPSGEEALAEQLAGLGCQIAHVVYESGPTGFALSRALERASFAVSVIAASRIPRGYAAAAKTVRIDAVKLANYSSRGLLRPIAIPVVEQEGYRSLGGGSGSQKAAARLNRRSRASFWPPASTNLPACKNGHSPLPKIYQRCRSRRNTVWR